jgi:hypothetical protein
MEKTENVAKLVSRRKARTRTEWRKEIQSFRASGLTVEEYAAKKGLVPKRLNFWLQAFRKDSTTKIQSAGPAFLPVSVRQTPSHSAAFARMLVEIDLPNGRRVRVHVKDDGDLSRISDLLAAVEGGNQC